MGLTTSAAAQEARILRYLQCNSGGLNRFEAESMLGVCHLARRIKTLADMGCPISKRTERAMDNHGVWHVGIARYFLSASSGQEVA